MKKCQKFALYQVKVRLFYIMVMEVRYIAKVRLSDKKRTLQTLIKEIKEFTLKISRIKKASK